MRDDRHRWTPYDGAWSPYEVGGIAITPVTPERQILISAPAVLSRHPGAIGWPDIATGDSYAISLRRDRVLLVNGPDMAEGWDDEIGQAVSDVTDAYSVFDLTGPKALELLKHGTEIGLQQPSRSAARMLFGLGVFLYRHGAEDRFRLHVLRAQGQTAWQMLTGQAGRL
ncbi:hypothetical protein [Thalassovita mangrovi]|uniref:Uncharacterized protein n=1 Tax=Thalassovita mangrovi TaxID=2692236 RepID=A0A6L8LFV1_9RHOB|nr:hypothetical protein [Thalassovita mangrovi]MYM54947.1 hypothetical protein [Thalassovita mangrovi]